MFMSFPEKPAKLFLFVAVEILSEARVRGFSKAVSHRDVELLL